jgi:hypothetical protein
MASINLPLQKMSLKHSKSFLLLLVFSIQMLISPVSLQSFEFERRRDQFIDTPGYLILPVPYNYPGVGGGMMLVGYAGNAFETKIDAILLAFNGDAEGYYLLMNEMFLVDEHLYLNANHMQVSKFGIQMWDTRGMETGADDYNTFVGDSYQQSRIQAVFTMLDRRLEFWYSAQNWAAQNTDIFTPDDTLVDHFDDPKKIESESTSWGVQLDLTDDRTDPRSGLRLKQSTTKVPALERGDPEYNVLSQSATLYIPILEDSTWVFHYFRSDATVTKEGETDPTVIAAESGIADCNIYPTPYLEGCQAAYMADANNTANANKYGTSETLGGAYRLRSYPEMRYKGAHTELLGTEFRWNISTTQSKINLFILEDIVHALQLSLFWEEGAVSETEETLGDIKRSTYGAGFRFVAESGNVYRLDWATGDEDSQVTVLFQYPWGESD